MKKIEEIRLKINTTIKNLFGQAVENVHENQSKGQRKIDDSFEADSLIELGLLEEREFDLISMRPNELASNQVIRAML
jgi:hypothetical protein